MEELNQTCATGKVVIERVHRLILNLKHWQAFFAVICLIGLVGYPLYFLCGHLFGWAMPFGDSPAPAIVLYICYGFWFDAVLSSRGKSIKRTRVISALWLLMFACASLWLRKDQPSPNFVYIAPLFLLAIFWLILILIPTANILRASTPAPRNKTPLWVDVVLIAAYFPFGLWIIQPRLNQSCSATSTSNPE